MEAIVDLISALFLALFQAVLALLELITTLVFLSLEFLFLTLTQGLSAATKQYQQRQQQRAERREQKAAAATHSEERVIALLNGRQTAIVASVVVLLIVAGVTTWIVREQIRKRRIAETRAQVELLAETFADEVEDDDAADPAPGLLPDRDAWDERIELFVDKALVGSLVVVRSPGPDRQSGTIDDILAIRMIQASIPEIGGELAERGMQALRDRAARLLPGKAKNQPADEGNADQR